MEIYYELSSLGKHLWQPQKELKLDWQVIN